MPHGRYTFEQAQTANLKFDQAVTNFLTSWLLLGSPDGPDPDQTLRVISEFADGGALREYFKRHDDPLEMLLRNQTIASHLCRNHLKVYFDPKTGNPLLSKFESRIYNFAAHREHFRIPYRYIKKERHDADGDHIKPGERVEITRASDIGDYFATRRADNGLIEIMHQQLRRSIHPGKGMDVELLEGAFIPETLEAIRQEAINWINTHPTQPKAFILHQRYDADDPHFGGAMLIFEPDSPRPKRILFCDSVPLPGAEPKFAHAVETTFGNPVPRIENVGNPDIQYWVSGLKHAYESDVNCSLYTQSMLLALTHTASYSPHKLLRSDAKTLQHEIAVLTPAYYNNGILKSREGLQHTNLDKRWDAGRSVLLALARERQRHGRTERGSWAEEVGRDRASIAYGFMHEDEAITRAAQGRIL